MVWTSSSVVQYYEHDNESLGSIIGGEHCDELSDYQLLKKARN